MGCRNDYQEPNELEIENSKVLAITAELTSGKLPSWFGEGSHKSVYNISSRETLDANTAALCSTLRGIEKKYPAKLKKMSLEAQIWWRDHKAFDRKRIAAERKEKSDAKIKAQALAKLSKKEKEVLGH